MSLLHAIICEISDREGVDPAELDPLYGHVDAEVLEVLTTGPDYRPDDPGLFVQFEYYGYTVKVDGAEDVIISGNTNKADEASKKRADGSLETLAVKLDHRESAMKEVTDIIAARQRPFRERLDGLLEVVRKTLNMSSATLSYVDNGSYVFEVVDVANHVEIEAGEIIPIGETVCKRVAATEQALVLSDVETDAPELADSACGVSSYLGVPVVVDGEVYGTFCFYDEEPRDEEFSDWELRLVELLSEWVSSELERRRRERAFHAATTERPYSVH